MMQPVRMWGEWGVRKWELLLLMSLWSLGSPWARPVEAGTKRAAAQSAVTAAMRQYYGTIRMQGDGDIKEIRDTLIANLPDVGEKMAKSVRNQLDKVICQRRQKSAKDVAR